MMDAEHLRNDADDRPMLDDTTVEAFRAGLRAPVNAAEPGPSPRAALPPLWGDSAPMAKLFEMLDRVAPTRANVLIVGESGVGKEVVAQHVHARSDRAGKPFIGINCGAIPQNLIEAELFGHEKGSFTGAVRGHKGVFERAADGTLFLDEVTEMSLELQVKLLRVLETGHFFRVGGDQELHAGCRIVAATNRHPERAVAEGILRADLLYRLAVFPLQVPPLRERGSDVELLAERFLAELNDEYTQEKTFSDAFREYLHSHQWPGNVREMKNTIHRAFILADHELEVCTTTLTTDPASCTEQLMIPVGTSIAETERKLILATLSRCDGNKRHAARVLGISLKTLYNRLNDYERFARTEQRSAA
ncbi:MAG: sigma-54 interaction domain-containing protein [Gammaproteobacteria bacterium]